PPKKGKGGGGGKKKGGGSSSGGVVDGIDTTEMNREQLEGHAHRLREELEREREERNFFQLERDKLKSFWDITRKELDETKAELRYAENMVSLKLSQEAHQDEEGHLLSDLKKIKEKLLEIELDHQEQIRALRLKHSEEVGALQEKFLRESKEIESKGERNLVSLRAEMTLAHQMELTEVEERKNMQINILMRNHEQAFTDAKNYYNDITLNNLALIGSLKEEMENLKQQTVRMEKQVRTLQAENNKLVQPLHLARKEVAELRRNLQNYERDKTCLSEVLERKDASIRELQWEVTRITKAHDDLICTYEAKLRQYGIPESELGFEPLHLSGAPPPSRGSTHDASITIGKRQRLGPAGLVTVNQ
ncbi:hypothetical protein J437_LFUL003137, partial [Ladona fulva]